MKCLHTITLITMLGSLAGVVGPAGAAVLYMPPAELTRNARQIVIGDVSEISYYWEDEARGLIRTRVTVKIDQYLSGQGSGIEVLDIPVEPSAS